MWVQRSMRTNTSIPVCKHCRETPTNNFWTTSLSSCKHSARGVFVTLQQQMKQTVTPPAWVCRRSSSLQQCCSSRLVGEKQIRLIWNMEYFAHGHWEEHNLLNSLHRTPTLFWNGIFYQEWQLCRCDNRQLVLRATAAPLPLLGLPPEKFQLLLPLTGCIFDAKASAKATKSEDIWNFICAV